MTVTLKPELEQMIADMVGSGRYKSVDAVMEEALRLLEARDLETEQKLAEVRSKLDRGLADLKAGRVIEGDKVWEFLGRSDPR